MKKKIDLILQMIEDEQPEQLRMFTTWVNHMFKGALEERQIAKIHELTEVKSMLTEIAEEIEERGMKRGIQQGMLSAKQEAALKMLQKGYQLEDIAEITGLSIEEIKGLKP